MKHFQVAVIAFVDAMSLDFVGPMDVFAGVNGLFVQEPQRGTPPYDIKLYSIDGKSFRASNGLQVQPEGAYTDIPVNQNTLLLLAGGIGVENLLLNVDFIAWLRQQSNHFGRVLSICSATFLLAQAGLLNGKSATTHWSVCELLQNMFPDIQVNENAIYIRNNNYYTSAGVSTGIDLALAIVMEDFGREVAMRVAQQLVLYLHRAGGQRQFSQIMSLQGKARISFDALVVWMTEHLEQALDIETLAAKACMSPRHFSRKFQQEVGVSPMRFLAQLRLERSRSLLEQGNQAIQTVAKACGFQSAETFRRQFTEHYGLSPVHYSGRF